MVNKTGAAAKLALQADRNLIKANGTDLSFITLKVTDEHGILAPEAGDLISFSIAGPGEIVATDNGDAANLDPYPATARNAFKGLALVIVRAKKGMPGAITVTATAKGLSSAKTIIKTK